ncbi:MAG: hypothetical protein ACRCXX_01390 [Cetobacterium sp.]|uniref:hypothetical protein n=1 Tax=Cetobacterium sp. TaxID=2071632 RepID=UPI003F351671
MEFYLTVATVLVIVLIASLILSFSILKNEYETSKEFFRKKNKLLIATLFIYNLMIVFVLWTLYKIIFRGIP